MAAFSGTLTQVGLITAATSMASIPAFIVWGNLSDHLHRRKLFIIEGFAGLAVSMGMMWLSVDFAMFLLANFLLGLLYAASAPAGTALLIEQTSREQWAEYLGRFSKMDGAGYLIGLTAGAAWFTFFASTAESMRMFFVLATAFAVSSAVVALLLVNDSRSRKGSAHLRPHSSHWNEAAGIPLHFSERAKYIPSRIGAVIRLAGPSASERKEIGRNLWTYYCVTALFSTGFTAFYVVFPNYLSTNLGTRFGIGESFIFLIYIGSSLTSTLTYGKVSAMARRNGEGRLQAAAASARVMIIPTFFLAAVSLRTSGEVLAAMLLLNALMGFCWAIISVTGQSMVASMAGPHVRGEAIGIYNSATGAGAIAGAMIGGVVSQFAGYFNDFIVSSALVASGVLLLLVTGVASKAGIPRSTGSPAK